MDPGSLQAQAAEAFTQGRFSQAAEFYERYCLRQPADHHAHVRLGEAWARSGQQARAVSAYRLAAEGFAREGFLPRALAASKRLLELDPSHRGVQQMLADLYARRSEPQEETTFEIDLGEGKKRLALQAASELLLPHTAVWAPPPPSAGEPIIPEPAAPPDSEQEPADTLLQEVEQAARASLRQHGTEASSSLEEALFSLAEEVSTRDKPLSALPDIPLFSDLPRDAFIEFFEGCPLRHFPKGHRVFERGSRGNAFYIICEGAVRVFRDEGKDLAALGIGAFFGEMALLSGAPRMATVESTSAETLLLEVPASVLAQLSRRYPQVARALKKFCRDRLLTNVMSTSALFQPFSRKDRRILVERFRARDVKRDELIVREGDRVEGLYVVLSGEVEASKGGQVLSRLREGDLFGEISLLLKTPATATVMATRRTSLLRLPREDFDSLILTHPQILELISGLSEQRLRRTEALTNEKDKDPTAENLLV
ncbi:cyclic nucleotide-binding domain-containing protein [Stigmatella sp. ncwal1]|uniref:Cyclic nucleotide-binding domain-containing protein n=1 Tax=Stigmatella ashevillensis TaxID=2995309 RepID=A0ABT5D1W5_9BACT|nr:cyclic nucleotide-binding domain-containing protein [Stigmatella ashevillena]MDC0707647.1 cyclic nucleotide-binding domain-containing protein [Stigmatella ashevillena]